MRPAPCEHYKPGTLVRPDLIPGYAEVGLTCVHGYMVDAMDRCDPDRSPATASAELPTSSEVKYAESNAL